jgi:hypothetical protein
MIHPADPPEKPPRFVTATRGRIQEEPLETLAVVTLHTPDPLGGNLGAVIVDSFDTTHSGKHGASPRLVGET